MDYQYDLEYTQNIGIQVMDRLNALSIPATPQNYQIWFAYEVGRIPELNKALQIVLSNDRDFTSELSDELYEIYFANTKATAESYQEVGSAMQAELDDLIENLESALSYTSQYGDTLEQTSGHLQQSSGSGNLKTMIDHLVSATRQMEQRSKTLESRLEESSDQVKNLQNNLEDIRREAYTDQLTGLPNRKAFDENLRKSAAESMETDDDLCLLFMDIDHFKKFNDTWGHQTGDTVLKLVSNCIKTNVKGKDKPARYGGEEFAVILPGTSLDQAEVLANQIRESVSSKKLQRKSTGEDLGTITISIGAAKYQLGENLNDFVHRSDSCLYAAKRSGRNRVVTELCDELEAVADLQEGAA